MRQRNYGMWVVVIALTLAVLGGVPARGTQPQSAPSFTAADQRAIRSAVDGYFEAFTAKDFASFGKYFQAPFVVFGRQVRILATLQDVVRQWRGIREPLDNSAYGASKVLQIRIIPVSSERALADIHWQRLLKDGAVMSEGAEFYFMSKSSGSWKLAGVMGQQLALFGQ